MVFLEDGLSIAQVDTACLEGINRVGFDGIVGSLTGSIPMVVHKFKEISLNLVCVEVFVNFKGLCLVERLGLTRVMVLSDSLMVGSNAQGSSNYTCRCGQLYYEYSPLLKLLFSLCLVIQTNQLIC